MTSQSVVVFGGTGAQAGPILSIVHPDLSAAGTFKITVPTRNTSSDSAQALTRLPNVRLIQAGYDSEQGLRAAFAGQDACYFIINSFEIREPDEYFWTMRAYEIAAQSGLKHFVYSGARNRLKDTGFNEAYRNSHNVVKAHMSDWLQQQSVETLPWTIVYGGVYAEMLGSVLCPMKQGEEFIFAAPVHEESIIPLMPLDNYGTTLAYILQHPTDFLGQFVDAGAIPSTWPEIVSAFVNVTKKNARFQPIAQDQWFEGAKKKGMDPDSRLPKTASADDPATFTFRKSFGSWWNMWRDNTRENELSGRTKSGDKLFVPGRIATLSEWMERTGYQGEPKEPTKMRREAASFP
ncbi:hypothetical protein DOTSEDRAFT_160585 [Dothistroma septosporum NZE10]|uniref:NmrA-like domain-containing protein n=2 Tax=Dothistroma septosporum TaxID=64363 RepID=M2YIV9_DOTSN|nr:hypothetical protein [Dothistroma septosporum]EME38870.1 hypothetical protein DOTSEDRAFT_160585 [Dothistroma septosporum NZE10]